MPELPEVHTTVTQLGEIIVGLKCTDVWSDYDSKHYYGKEQVKDPAYFELFRKKIIGKEIIGTERIAKNVLIHLEDNLTILIHMKMTGHLLYGLYAYEGVRNRWVAKEKGPLRDDKWNGWIRMVWSFGNKKHLAFSDLRKFAKVTLLETDKILEHKDLQKLGPDPINNPFPFSLFKERLFLKQNGKIKQVLMNQEIIAGVGNIYSDEALWLSEIHPEKEVCKISVEKLQKLHKNTLDVLKKGIDFKGDSMSDYRTPSGEPGEFQTKHNVYQRKGEICKKRGCDGVIERIKVGGRSAHFCPQCQR